MSSKVHQGGCSFAASHADGFPRAYSSPPVCRRREADKGLLVAALQRDMQPGLREGWEMGEEGIPAMRCQPVGLYQPELNRKREQQLS